MLRLIRPPPRPSSNFLQPTRPPAGPALSFAGSAMIFSPLQLGAMFEFHATDQAIVMHNLLEQKVAVHSEMPIGNGLALHYVLQAWRTVSCLWTY